MKKEILIVCVLMLFLVACGGKPEVSGKRVASTPTAAVVSEPEPEVTPVAEPEETKTAAEALQEAKAGGELTETTAVKSGNSWYPPITSTKTGKDALLERSHAAYSTSTFNNNVEADKESGSRYYDSSGNPTNLPEGYGEGSSYE